MIYKKSRIENIIKDLENKDIINKPYLLTFFEYDKLKKLKNEFKDNNILNKSIESFEKLGIYDKKHYDFFRNKIIKGNYNKFEIFFLRECILKDNRVFFIKVMKFTSFKDEEDLDFYLNLLKIADLPIFVKREDYEKATFLLKSYKGMLFRNCFALKEVDDFDKIDLFLEKLYTEKIERIHNSFDSKKDEIIDRIKRCDNYRITCKMISMLKNKWQNELNDLIYENKDILLNEKIKTLNNEIMNLKIKRPES